MELEQPARAGKLGVEIHRHGHFRNEGSVAVRWHVLLHLLLAHRGPLDAVDQLPPLGGAENLVSKPFKTYWLYLML